MVKLRYRIVVEGDYEVDPLDYDTINADEIAEAERTFAKEDVADFLVAIRDMELTEYLEPSELIILPV